MSERGADIGGAGESDGAALHRANAQQSRMKRLERLHSNGDSSLMGVVVRKVCCVCATELNHRPRFKDSEGRYWCPQCNEVDQLRKQLVPCADCAMEIPRAELREVRGELVCGVCAGRRRGTSQQVHIKPAAVMSHMPAPARKESNVLWVTVLIGGAVTLMAGLVWFLRIVI